MSDPTPDSIPAVAALTKPPKTAKLKTLGTTAPIDRSFNNGSSVSIGTCSVGMLTEFHAANNRASTKTSGVGVSQKTFRGGRHNVTLTVGFLGSKCPLPGSVMALAAALTDGGSYSYPAVGLTQVRISGRKDATIEGSITGRPAPPRWPPRSRPPPWATSVSTAARRPSPARAAPPPSARPNSLNSLTYEGTCAEAEDTGAGDPSVIVTPGIPDETVTIEAVGSVTLAQGDVGPLTVAWNDGGTIGSGDYWEVMTAKDGGQEDGEITCEYTFKRRKSASA